jgi:enoyl-[acyl-carrier-protein] reductase (NADH)
LKPNDKDAFAMLLENQVAVIYGAGGSIGGAVARAFAREGARAGRDDIAASIQQAALLNWTATLADVGNVAAFVASDLARTMTAADVNISCGAIMD